MRLASAILLAPSLLLFSLAGCGSGAIGEPEGQPGAGQNAAAVPPPEEQATLELEADGIVVPVQMGTAERLAAPFGSMRAATEATLETVAGGALSRGENTECGAGPMQVTQYDGLTLYFQEDRLVGYLASAPYVPELERAQMLQDPGVAMVPQSTLGEEFVIGDPEGAAISGLFDGAGDDAAIEALWAGASCVFR